MGGDGSLLKTKHYTSRDAVRDWTRCGLTLYAVPRSRCTGPKGSSEIQIRASGKVGLGRNPGVPFSLSRK